MIAVNEIPEEKSIVWICIFFKSKLIKNSIINKITWLKKKENDSKLIWTKYFDWISDKSLSIIFNDWFGKCETCSEKFPTKRKWPVNGSIISNF